MKRVLSKYRWPKPEFEEADQPHFLFIITPPFSGSTALSELINSSHRTMVLHRKGEGQWIVPGLCESNRWNSKKKVDYSSVKAVWISKYQEVNQLVQNIDVVIEKSPPNLVRMEELASHFEKRSFLANNRNPYANCASVLYRKYDAESLDANEREKILKTLVTDWLSRSARIKELKLLFDAPLLTYEDFCSNPASLLEILDLPADVIKSINPEAKIKVKDYEMQVITNQNERQISRLSKSEIEYVGELLESDSDLLDFFGYSLLSPSSGS